MGISKKAQTEAKDSNIGQLAEKGYKPTEIARLTGKSTAQVYRTLSVAQGETPVKMRGQE
jgi:DNA invertase Pin-like site-specific DNA recombinase